jgi:outer membrane lipoprotein-sorting protein
MHLQMKNSLASGFVPVAFLCLVLLISGGCARQPWTDQVNEDQAKAIRNMIQEIQKTDAACSSTLDAEVVVSWKTGMETKAFSGFLQMKQPSSVKFVTTNPLGQTIAALVSDGDSFRSVNTVTRQFLSGSLLNLALRNDIPPELLTGNWGSWLSGRIEIPKSSEIVDIRQDASSRGIWVLLANPKNRLSGKEFVLIDPQMKRPLSRVLMNAEENPIARIEYGDWQKGAGCEQPAHFHITGLSMGAEITIQLSDIITDKVFTEKDFSLSPPPGYFIELRP